MERGVDWFRCPAVSNPPLMCYRARHRHLVQRDPFASRASQRATDSFTMAAHLVTGSSATAWLSYTLGDRFTEQLGQREQRCNAVRSRKACTAGAGNQRIVVRLKSASPSCGAARIDRCGRNGQHLSGTRAQQVDTNGLGSSAANAQIQQIDANATSPNPASTATDKVAPIRAVCRKWSCTGTKSAQNIQSIPMTVTAITGAQLENQNIQNFQQFAIQNPQIQFISSASCQRGGVHAWHQRRGRRQFHRRTRKRLRISE